MNDFIPVNEPLLDGNEKKYLLECIDSGWISFEGPFVRELEEGFARRIGRPHGIAVANGSGASEIAVQSLRLGPGDEFILMEKIFTCEWMTGRASDYDTWGICIGLSYR